MKPRTKRESEAKWEYMHKGLTCHKRSWWNFWKREYHKVVRQTKKSYKQELKDIDEMFLSQ